MTIRQTAAALFAVAAVATGATAVSTSAAEAGYVVKFKHHGHHYSKPWKHYGYVYRPHCVWQPVKVWTHYGPVWVNKKHCY